MLSTDPIADMLSRIRNAIMVNKTSVSMPHSKIKETVARELSNQNFIDTVAVEGEGIEKRLVIDINKTGTNARITKIEKVSRPGRRVYAKATDNEGVTQPMVVVSWNPKGYLNNACHRIAVKIV